MGREPLAIGRVITINNQQFTIKNVCGCGTSSIVYKAADNNQQNVIVKEIYPAGLGITRAVDGSLQVPENNIQFFTAYIERAEEAFEKQKEIYNSESTNNSTLFTYTNGEYNKTDYYVSRYNAGCTLKEWIQNNRNDTGFIRNLLLICSRIAGVLQQYHEKGLLHLDVKPDNILVTKNDYYVLMFDFDSVYTLDDLKNEYVRYSPGYVAPEVEYFPGDIDLHKTDIFSVGAILYEGVFGKVPQDDVQNFGYEFVYSGIDALKSLSPQLQPMLTKIFKRTLSIVVSSRYSGKKNDDLASALSAAQKIASREYYLANDDIKWDFTNKKIMQRTKELEYIHKNLQEKKVAYLYGAGGTGKTMLAKAYAAKYKNEYDFVQSVRYRNDLKDTLSDIRVIGSDSNKSKTPAGIVLLRDTTAKTLIIIDNYDYKESEADLLYSLLERSSSTVRFIITCRTEPDTLFKANNKLEPYFSSYPTDKPDSDFKSALAELFFSNSCYELAEEKSKKIRSEYEQDVKRFAEKYHHIMLTDLASRFANKILINNRKFFPEYMQILNSDVASGASESEQYEKEVYSKLSALFDFAGFDYVKKYIMLNACVMAQSGVEEEFFCEMVGIKVDKMTKTNTAVNELVSSSWLVREIKQEFFEDDSYPHITIHPLIAQVCMEKLLPDADLEETFTKTAKNLSELMKETIDYLTANNIIYFPKSRSFMDIHINMVNNLFRMIDLVMDKKNNSPNTSSEFNNTLTDLLSYYIPANKLYDGITACTTYLKMDSDPLAKEKLVIMIGLYNEAYNIYDLPEQCLEAFSDAVNEYSEDPSSVTSIGLRIAEYSSLLNTLSVLSGNKVENAKTAYDLISQFNLTGECAMTEIFRCGCILSHHDSLDEAKQCAAYLKKGLDTPSVQKALTGSAHSINSQLILYLVLQGDITISETRDLERALVYLLAADDISFAILRQIFGHKFVEKIKQYTGNSALQNPVLESIMDLYDIPYCQLIAHRHNCLVMYSIMDIVILMLGLDEEDCDKDETEEDCMTQEIMHKLNYFTETYFFKRGDYEHAAKKLPLPPFRSNYPDEEKKSEIVSKYRLQSRIYRDLNNDRKAKLYEERADEIERNFDNRKNIFEELFSDFEEKPV